MADAELTLLERDAIAQPSSAAAQARLAHAYARVGRFAEAGRLADRAADLDPQHEPLALRWGEWRTVSRNAARTASVEYMLWAVGARPAACWRRALAVTNSPVLSEGKVLVPAGGQVHALDVATGSTVWTSGRLQEPLSAPAIACGLAIVKDDMGIHALELATGEVAWVSAHAAAMSDAGHLAVGRGTVVAQTRGSLSAFELHNGTPKWTVPWGHARVPPALRDGVVLVSGPNGGGIVDLATGRVLHRRNDSSEVGDTVLIGPAGVGYVSTIRRGKALDLRTGETLWTDALSEGRGLQCMALLRDFLIVESRDTVTAFDSRTGSERWRSAVGRNGMAWGPVIAGDHVLVGCEGYETLVALDPQTGERSFTAPLPERCGWRPALAPGMIVGAGRGSVFALALE